LKLLLIILFVSIPLIAQAREHTEGQAPTAQSSENQRQIVIDGWWDIDWAKGVCEKTHCGINDDEIERQVIEFERSVAHLLAATSTCSGVGVSLFLGTYNKKYGSNTWRSYGDNEWDLSFNPVVTKLGLEGIPFWQMSHSGHHYERYQGQGALKDIAGDACAIAGLGRFSNLGAKAVPQTSCPSFKVPEDYEVPDGYVRVMDAEGIHWDIPKENLALAKAIDRKLMVRDDSDRESWTVSKYTSNPQRWTFVRSDRSKRRQFRYIVSCEHSSWGDEAIASGGCNLPVGTTLTPDFLFGPVTDVWEHEMAGDQQVMFRGHCFSQTFGILNKTVEQRNADGMK
jgi:hypothetical protein